MVITSRVALTCVVIALGHFPLQASAVLADFEQAYNTQRPHQARGYQTTAEALGARPLSPASERVHGLDYNMDML